MSFFSYTEPQTSTSVALTHTKLYIFIPVYMLKVFTEGFVHIQFAWLYTAPKFRKHSDFCPFYAFSGLWNDKNEIPKILWI